VDWIKFKTPPGLLPVFVQIRTVSVPAVAGKDSSDIDVYVLHEPSPGAQLDSIGAFAHPGSSIDTTFILKPDSVYYAVVVDFAGVPTPYEICIGPCVTFPTPPAQVATPAQLQAATRRRAALEARAAALRAARPRD